MTASLPMKKKFKKYILLAFILPYFFIGISTVQSAQVTLAWNPVTHPDLAGYKLHYGDTSGSYPNHLDTGPNTTYTVTNLQDGGTYYFAVTAFDSSGNESGYSNEVSYTASLACSYTISPTSNSMSASGGTGIVNVAAPSGCAWTGVSNSSWILLTSNSSGTANGAINYSASANSSSVSRSGTMTIAGKTFTVNQAGVSCSYAISPTSQTFESNGGTGTIAVTAPGGCSWNASSSASWISIVGGSSGSGNGSVNFSVSTNSGASIRTGTVTVGGKTFAVTQNSMPQFTLALSKNGTGTGSIANTPAGNSFTVGTVVTLTAAPDVSSNFSGWSGACTGTSPNCSVTMNSNASTTATFNLKSFSITAGADANGSILPQGSVTVNYGAGQTFSINPNPGYQVADVKVNGVSVGTVTSYSLANVTSDQAIYATFSAIPASPSQPESYALTLTQIGTGTGSILANPTGTSFSAGTAVTLTAVPDESSIFTGWSGGCSGTSPTCTITMNSNQSVTANFDRKTYTIAAVAGDNGSITPPGAVNVGHGESKSFIITAAKGCKIANVKVDGVSIGTPDNFSFGNVKANHRIEATFLPASLWKKKR